MSSSGVSADGMRKDCASLPIHETSGKESGAALRRAAGSGRALENSAGPLALGALEHVPKKLIDFFDQNMLQLIDLERVLVDWMMPSKRNAL